MGRECLSGDYRSTQSDIRSKTVRGVARDGGVPEELTVPVEAGSADGLANPLLNNGQPHSRRNRKMPAEWQTA
jgi:hypothetical protein